jgi:hypothetical protein
MTEGGISSYGKLAEAKRIELGKHRNRTDVQGHFSLPATHLRFSIAYRFTARLPCCFRAEYPHGLFHETSACQCFGDFADDSAADG